MFTRPDKYAIIKMITMKADPLCLWAPEGALYLGQGKESTFSDLRSLLRGIIK